MARRAQSGSPFSLFSFQDIITCVSGIIILITLMLALELSQRTQPSAQADTLSVVSQLRESISEAEAEIERLKSALEQHTSRAEQLAGVTVELIRRDIFDLEKEIEQLTFEVHSLAAKENELTKIDEQMQAQLFDRQKQQDQRTELATKVTSMENTLKQIRERGQLFFNRTTPDGKNVWIVQIDSNRVLVAPAGQKRRATEFTGAGFGTVASSMRTWLRQLSPKQDYLFLLVRPGGSTTFNDVYDTVAAGGFAVGFDLLGAKQLAVDLEDGAALP